MPKVAAILEFISGYRATVALIAANVAVFVVMVWLVPGPWTPPVLASWGGAYAGAVLDGRFWLVVTAPFVHSGGIHLAGNMFALYSLGPMAEEHLGPRRFVILYAASGILATIASLVLHPPNIVIVGASGAIYGLMGVATGMALSKHPWISRKGLLINLAINVAISISVPNVDWIAHAAGFVVGCILYPLLAPDGRFGLRGGPDWKNRTLSRQCLAEGRILIAAGDLEGASAALDMAVRADGRSVEALVERAVTRLLTGRLSEGQTDLKLATRLAGRPVSEAIRAAMERASQSPVPNGALRQAWTALEAEGAV